MTVWLSLQRQYNICLPRVSQDALKQMQRSHQTDTEENQTHSFPVAVGHHVVIANLVS